MIILSESKYSLHFSAYSTLNMPSMFINPSPYLFSFRIIIVYFIPRTLWISSHMYQRTTNIICVIYEVLLYCIYVRYGIVAFMMHNFIININDFMSHFDYIYMYIIRTVITDMYYMALLTYSVTVTHMLHIK